MGRLTRPEGGQSGPYLGTPKYRSLSLRTRKLYRDYLDMMRREWGELPIRGIRRGTNQKIKIRFETTPRKANQVVALFRILLKLAVDREYLSTNPAAEPDMLATPARVQIWTHDEEDEFLDAAPPSIRLAFLLMLYTMQRPSDVLAMSRNHVSEKRGPFMNCIASAEDGAIARRTCRFPPCGSFARAIAVQEWPADRAQSQREALGLSKF